MRLGVIAYTRSAGHRSAAATKDAILHEFRWAAMSEDVDLFVSSCIQCLSTKGGGKLARPCRPTLLGTKLNVLVKFDYIKLAQRFTGEKYFLMIVMAIAATGCSIWSRQRTRKRQRMPCWIKLPPLARRWGSYPMVQPISKKRLCAYSLKDSDRYITLLCHTARGQMAQ